VSKLADVVPAAIDQIVTDIQTNVTATETAAVFKYAEPKAVTPERTPLLACWLGPSRYEALDTTKMSLKPRVVVAWYLSAAQGAEGGGDGNDAVVSELVATADEISDRLERLMQGVPGLPHLYGLPVQATVTSDDGAVYKCAIEVDLEWL
jgi:hypothetical protein